jgi:hypothetical protein
MDQRLNKEVKKYTTYYKQLGENYLNSIKEKDVNIKNFKKQLKMAKKHNESLQTENKHLWKVIKKLITTKNQSIVIEKKTDNIVEKPMNIQSYKMEQILSLNDDNGDEISTQNSNNENDCCHYENFNDDIKKDTILSLVNPDELSTVSSSMSPNKGVIKKEIEKKKHSASNTHDNDVEIIEIKKEVDVIELEDDKEVEVDLEEEQEEVEEEEEEQEEVEEEEVEEEEVEEEEVEEEQEEEEEEEEEQEEVEETAEEEEVEEEEVEEEEVEEEEVEEEEVEEEEEEEEVYVVKIEGIDYYTTNEKNGKIYKIMDDDDVGDELGYYEDGEPGFYE